MFAHEVVKLNVLVLRIQLVLVVVTRLQDHRVLKIIVLSHSFPFLYTLKIVVLKGVCERVLHICCARQIFLVSFDSPFPRSAP